MQNSEVLTREQINDFLKGTEGVSFVGGRKEEVYAWVERVLVAQEFLQQDKERWGAVRAYLLRRLNCLDKIRRLNPFFENPLDREEAGELAMALGRIGDKRGLSAIQSHLVVFNDVIQSIRPCRDPAAIEALTLVLYSTAASFAEAEPAKRCVAQLVDQRHFWTLDAAFRQSIILMLAMLVFPDSRSTSVPTRSPQPREPNEPWAAHSHQ